MAEQKAVPADQEQRTLAQKRHHEAWTKWLKYHDVGESLKSHLEAHRKYFRPVARTGVKYVASAAKECGYTSDDPEWANLGQGAPETGPLEGQPERPTTSVSLDDPALNAYPPTDGDQDLKEAIANYYNKMYRQGKSSQYTARNVTVTGGGRSALARVLSCLNDLNVGYMLPDYTAYEELLSTFSRIKPVPVLSSSGNPAITTTKDLKHSVRGLGLGAVLFSNPRNPTGHVVSGDDLRDWVSMSCHDKCMLISDEFYGHYLYNPSLANDSMGVNAVSAAAHVDDVDKDPVVIINGFTKSWRRPGWRMCWAVGPVQYAEKITAAGTFLDGGAPHPLQKAAVGLLDMDYVRQDAHALQRHFKQKRDYMLGELKRLGITVDTPPDATFYIWANLKDLPPPLDEAVAFFEEALSFKVICVPGIFFDINPSRQRHISHSPFRSHVRISYGPPMEMLQQGIKNIEKLIQHWKEHGDIHEHGKANEHA